MWEWVSYQHYLVKKSTCLDGETWDPFNQQKTNIKVENK